MNEIFVPVIGYETLYEVSNLGNVRAMGNGNSNNSKARSLKKAIKPGGYCMVGLYRNGKWRAHKVHRLVATAFISNSNQFPQINHKNKITSDNRVENLEWCDARHNTNHSYADRKHLTSSCLRGVCRDKRKKKWMAQAWLNGKHKFLGYFKTEKEASLAYESAIVKCAESQ